LNSSPPFTGSFAITDAIGRDFLVECEFPSGVSTIELFSFIEIGEEDELSSHPKLQIKRTKKRKK
jgi:hypothetical protein